MIGVSGDPTSGTAQWNFDVTLTSQSDLSLFIGPNQFSTSMFISALSDVDNGVGILNIFTPQTITFTYIPIPEPAAWAMMLLGFAGLGVALRSRRFAATS